MHSECSICSGEADTQFRRIQVWANERWRLTTTTYRVVRGLCYLEPKKHIRYITELDGTEATEFGGVLSLVTRALKKATSCTLVYVYIYGGHIPHLHVHIAPHTEGDAFFDDVVKSNARISEDIMADEEIRVISESIMRELNR